MKVKLAKFEQCIFKGRLKAYYTRHLKYCKKAYHLTADLYFPPASEANKNVCRGPVAKLLAVGGDLSPERLMLAYQKGIYPLYYQDEPILWWTVESRCVVFLKDLHIRKGVKRFIRNEDFKLTGDKAYFEVVKACSENRAGPTWLIPERQEAAVKLYELGLAHSVEVWRDGRLIGGVFGILMGSYFYSESMFTRENNGSKVALTALGLKLKEMNFTMLDLGIWPTENLRRFGAVTIACDEYLKELNQQLEDANMIGKWSDLFENWNFKEAVKEQLNNRGSILR